MEKQLSPQALKKLLQSTDVASLSDTQLQQLFTSEDGIKEYIPDGICQIDPRTGDRIVFNSSRARRPHDNQPVDWQPAGGSSERNCVICEGNTTGVVDVAELSQGFTFINKNLFPILYPEPASKQGTSPEAGGRFPSSQCMPAYGYHFLQWTSSLHEVDWHNMPHSDRVVVMKRLAALEKKLISDSRNSTKSEKQALDNNVSTGYVSIIKNFGRLVGGSLAHGHQQIAISNVVPRRVLDHERFEMEHGELFSAYMQRGNPPTLLLRDYGPAALLVPYFMRRPYDMFLLIKDASKRYLYELDESEIAAAAGGWRDAIRAILAVMPRIGKESAYNVITNSGPGTGLYFEFLPYTQETGGFEHLGLYLCQGNPEDSARQLRGMIQTYEAD